MSCEICGGNGHRRDFHDLADRIAKLEARLAASDMLSALRAKLAEPRTLDELMPSPVSTVAGPIPRGYKLAPGWSTAVPPALTGGPLACISEGCYADAVFFGRNGVCASHAVEMGAIVKVESPAEQPASAPDELPTICGSCVHPPHVGLCYRRNGQTANPCPCIRSTFPPPAPAQGAPAEPLISECDVIHCRGDCRRCEVAAIEARLAEKERSVRLVRLSLDEERRCYDILKDKLADLEARLAAVTNDRMLEKQMRKDAGDRVAELEDQLASAERERDELRRDFDEMNKQRHSVIDQLCIVERERDEAIALQKSTQLDLQQAESHRDEAMAISGRAADEIRRLRAERDEAVAAERERCLYHVEMYEPRRDVQTDWSYQGALSRVAEAIRDGRPAPK